MSIQENLTDRTNLSDTLRDQSEFTLEGGGWRRKWGVLNFFRGVGGGPGICLFGLIASNRTIIPEICCCDVFWCEEQCVLCLVFVIVYKSNHV